MKKWWIFCFILILIFGCTKPQIENSEKLEKSSFNESSNLIKEEFTNDNLNRTQNKLPPCPSETATNCDRSKIGITESDGKKRYSETIGNNCEGYGIVNFTYAPMKLEDIGFIEPLGLMLGSHVTPIDHQYYYQKDWVAEPTEADLKDVFAPADGIITSIQAMPSFFSHVRPELGDYRIILAHTCSFYTIYIHVYKLSDKIYEQVEDLKPGENKGLNILVKAGELIGKANSFDFSAHNEDVVLSGFIVPEHYTGEPWKIHTVDPFDYFVEPLKSKLLEKNLRLDIPRGGKIDYDINGRLIGNWFKENTNGYRGIKQPEYWVTHLSISPDGLDPEHIIVSLGDFKGEAMQFGVKGNSPNPKDVDVSTGLVKYKLVHYSYYDLNNKRWESTYYAKGLKAKNNEEVNGVVLLQLISDRKLKVEIFPDKTDVDGFTEKAMIYER